MKLKFIPFVIMLLASTAYADANWGTQVDDDVFSGGKTATMIGILLSGDAVFFECNGGDKITVSLVSKVDNKISFDPPVPADLFIKIDENKAVKLNALIKRRNSSFVGAESSDRNSILTLLKQLQSAKKKIIVGLSDKAGGVKNQYPGEVQNSTSSVSTFVEACKIKL
ncbi:hypothetical protein IRL25_002504 [Salmonella enterica]|nr:hypothetical protein [Salmonella enterica]